MMIINLLLDVNCLSFFNQGYEKKKILKKPILNILTDNIYDIYNSLLPSIDLFFVFEFVHYIYKK